MLEYIIGSGICCMVISLYSSHVSKTRAEELGYVSIAEKKKVTPKRFVLGVLSNFIPVVNNLVGLILFIYSGFLLFASDDLVSQVFNQVPSLAKANRAIEIFERREKNNNFEEIKDAMILDGADEKTIKMEMKEAKIAASIPSKKEMNKVSAMSDSKQFLDVVKLDASLSENQEKELYFDYVKDFRKKNSKEKAIQKTLRMVNKRK